jgi:hypothetical protein
MAAIRKRLAVAMALAVMAVALVAPVASAAPGSINSLGWAFFKDEEFEEALADNDYEPMKGMFLMGGTFLMPVSDEWSVGFGYAGTCGWSKSEERSAYLETGYFGVAAEYGFRLGDKTTIGLGGVAGLGVANLRTKQGILGGFEDPDGGEGDNLLDAANAAQAWRPYLVAQPTATITFSASPLVDVSISGGYILMWSPIGWVDGWAFKEHFEGPLKTMAMPFVQLGVAFSFASAGGTEVWIEEQP